METKQVMQSVFILTLLIFMFLGKNYAISFNDLRNITYEIAQENNLPYTISLNINNNEAGGFAAIQYNAYNNQVSIFVDSRKLAQESANTWAFVIGHELGHKYTGRGGTPKGEWDADIYGAKWAINSGYDVRRYVYKLLRDPNSCSPSHGCWHNRAYNIARRYGVQVNSEPEDHRNHKPATGPFPSILGSICILARQSFPRPSTLRQIRVACQHYIPCQHIYFNGYGYVRQHKYDVAHPFDIQYIRN